MGGFGAGERCQLDRDGECSGASRCGNGALTDYFFFSASGKQEIWQVLISGASRSGSGELPSCSLRRWFALYLPEGLVRLWVVFPAPYSTVNYRTITDCQPKATARCLDARSQPPLLPCCREVMRVFIIFAKLNGQ